MYDRYRIKDPDAVNTYVEGISGVRLNLLAPRFNISPNYCVPVIDCDAARKPIAGTMRWNLIALCEPADGPALVCSTVRAEDILIHPNYQHPVQRRRCLLPADGFYVWEKNASGARTPRLFQQREARPFTFAGIWEPPTASRPATCAFLTTRANSAVAFAHDRMPVILSDENAMRWLEPGELTPETLAPLVEPFPAHLLESYRVSPRLNNVANDRAEDAAPFRPMRARVPAIAIG
jgi:putative SOS response-associated peptidase YedK